MGQFNNVDEIGGAVDDAPDGVVLCEAIDLRDAAGESRLKALARVRVGEALASRGLVALPEVPENQEQPVYVTRQSSEADLLFKAFTRPGQEALQVVRGAIGGTGEVANQQDAVKQVAELLGEASAELEKMLGKSEVAEQ
ncbi:MAG TPA: hypothetical protein VIH47_03635 [Solirubrobacterales bacterium]